MTTEPSPGAERSLGATVQPQAGPDPRNVIARAFDEADDSARQPHTRIHGTGPFYADALLAAIGTDPAVTQALLDALVAAGVLAEERRVTRPCGCSAGIYHLKCCAPDEPVTLRTRLVTVWREAGDER